MNSDLLLQLYKIALISGFLSIVMWGGYYTHTARWWTNPLGRTLMVMEVLVAALFIPFTLLLFFHLSRQNSQVVAYIDLILIGLTTPAMCWRTAVWVRFHRRGQHARNSQDGPGGQT